MPVVNECKCVGSSYQLPQYREVASDDWGQRERWEEEGEEGGESGAVRQEEVEVHQSGDVVADVPSQKSSALGERVEDHSVYTLKVEFEGFVCLCPCVDLGRILTFVR